MKDCAKTLASRNANYVFLNFYHYIHKKEKKEGCVTVTLGQYRKIMLTGRNFHLCVILKSSNREIVFLFYSKASWPLHRSLETTHGNKFFRSSSLSQRSFFMISK